MKKQLLLISGTLMLTAALLPASVSAANWTDDSQKPDTLGIRNINLRQNIH